MSHVTPVEYRISLSDPHAHLLHVVMHIASPAAGGQQLRLPDWIPGSYMIREFSRHIVAINASSGGQAVTLVKCDKSCWQAPAGLNELTVEYQVYAWDLSVRSAHFDATHAFFNATSVCLAAVSQESLPCKVLLRLPAGEAYKNWQVATAMPALAASEVDTGWYGYQTRDYDELIDHPVEAGTFTRLHFDACGVPHEVILTGRFVADEARICADLATICEYQIRLFGEPAPYQRYLFMVMVVGNGYGGLEHRASTALMVSRDSLPVPGDASTSDEYLQFLGLCSHEYFHNWNVKRIKPAIFEPYQLDREVHTPLLWFFEGVTSYYDDWCLLRAGLISLPQYLTLLGKTITRVHQGAGRLQQSVAASSYDAWTRFYKQDENATNAIVSYYAKGALVALCLDMQMRTHSEGKVSLDDVMRALWRRWLDGERGVADDDIEKLAAELCGRDLSDFFAHAVYGTDDLDLSTALATIGITVHWRGADSAKDAGGSTGKAAAVSANADETEGAGSGSNEPEHNPVPLRDFGARYTAAPGGVKLLSVATGSPAMRAGLAANDVVVAIDGLAVSVTAPEKLLQYHREGTTLSVHAFRRDELMQFQLPVQCVPSNCCFLQVDTDAAGAVSLQRQHWQDAEV